MGPWSGNIRLHFPNPSIERDLIRNTVLLFLLALLYHGLPRIAVGDSPATSLGIGYAGLAVPIGSYDSVAGVGYAFRIHVERRLLGTAALGLSLGASATSGENSQVQLSASQHTLELPSTIGIWYHPTEARIAPFLALGGGLSYVNTSAKLVMPLSAGAASEVQEAGFHPVAELTTGIQVNCSNQWHARLPMVYRRVMAGGRDIEMFDIGIGLLWTVGSSNP